MPGVLGNLTKHPRAPYIFQPTEFLTGIRKRYLLLSGFFELFFEIPVIDFSLLLLVNLILYQLPVVSVVFSQRPAVFLELIIDIGICLSILA